MKQFVRLTTGLILFGALATGTPAATPEQTRDALDKATTFLQSIATEGGYLWSYSEDLKSRRGEETATPSQIWVQPPGTPSVGQTFLRAYDTTRDAKHFDAAQATALALVRGQLESGGWSYLIEFDPGKRKEWTYRADSAISGARSRNTTTFDDNNTQSALRFLLAFWKAARERNLPEVASRVREAIDYGLLKMIEAQYPNGAWPQRYEGRSRDLAKYPVQPARYPKEWSRRWPNKPYGDFYTFNDNTQRDCIETMLEAFKILGERKYRDAALRGGDFLILAQLPEPQPGWAQQYNFNLEPDWARAFEPPAVCTGESAGVIRLLVDLHLETGEEKFLKPIPAAIAWLMRSQISSNRWARLYELETNQPIYGDRDGLVHYRLEEISLERQRGYGWQGDFGILEAVRYYETLRRAGRERQLALRNKSKPERNLKSLERAVAQIMETQDPTGRWLSGGRIETRTFVRNMNTMCDFLEAAGPKQNRTYQNPLNAGEFFADPHVIKVGGTYYLYATTHTRGYDAYVSKDLVHWENKGTVFDDPRRGAWAPDVFHNRRGDGKFYLYYTDNIADRKAGGPQKQIGVAVADSPLGPFQDHSVLVKDAIDAHLFQDDDGNYYFYYVDLFEGFKIRVQPMADPVSKQPGPAGIVNQPTEAWEKVSGHVTEGPFMLKRNGVYYLMYSGTGADSPNYGIGYATAKSPLGPFAKHPGNPIVQRGGKVLGPGHHCVIEGPDQKLWNVYHQKWDDKTNFNRFLAIDPIWFDDQGVIHGKASRQTEEPAP